MLDADLPQVWLDAIRLFNAGEYFACHDAIEELWRDLPEGVPLPGAGPEAPTAKRFVQGVLQLAVTLVHLQRGNPRGVRTVYSNALEKLRNSPAKAMGIDVQGLLGEMSRVVDPVLRMPKDAFHPGRPRGELPWDADKPPLIRRV